MSNPDYFLKAVTDLGDTRNIVAARDIYSDKGQKLVAEGFHISSKIYDRLIEHQVVGLETALQIDGVLDPSTIMIDLDQIISASAKLQNVVEALGTDFHLQKIILPMKLPSPLTFRLTIAREKYNDIYQRSLCSLILCVYMAYRDGLKPQEATSLAIAALFHNLGLLHINPDLLAVEHVMTIKERRHLYAHPLTGYIILKDIQEISPKIASAVLEHHERMDGRGYPRGITGDKISRYGQMLAVAEVTAKLFKENPGVAQWKRLEVMLKLNSKQYGNLLIGYLLPFIKSMEYEQEHTSTVDQITDKVVQIAALIDNFNQHGQSSENDKVFEFAKQRLTRMMVDFYDAGIDLRNPAELLKLLGEDDESMADLAPLLNEAIWQFKALIEDTQRIHETMAQPHEHSWLQTMKASLVKK